MTDDKTALDALEKFIKLHTAIDDRKSPNFIKRNISEEAFAAKDAFEQIRAIINTRPQPSGDAVKKLADFILGLDCGYPSHNEGAIDTAIRMITDYRAALAKTVNNFGFDEAFKNFVDWECEAYSRGIAIEDEDVDKLRLFYDYLATQGLVGVPDPDFLRQNVHEQIEEGGYWSSCSGCHETNEGYATGNYSDIFKTHLGMGCHECGGIGAVWYQPDDDMEAMIKAAPKKEGAE